MYVRYKSWSFTALHTLNIYIKYSNVNLDFISLSAISFRIIHFLLDYVARNEGDE